MNHNSVRQPIDRLILYGLTGFSGLLAEQGFEKYISLLVGATASASAVVIFAYFLGFAVGSAVASECMKRGWIRRPFRLYGLLELLIGASCIAFTFVFHPLVARLAPFQAYYSSPLLKFAVRFVFGSILVLPTAALMGASFPLIAHALDRQDATGGKRWTEAYAVNLVGATLAALLGAYAILPAIGIRGSFWLCFAVGAGVFVATLALGEEFTVPAGQEALPAEERASPGRDAWVLLAGAFASGLAFFALEVIWTHLISVALGSSIYAFADMLAMVLIGLLIGAFRVRRSLERNRTVAFSRLLQFSALVLIFQFRCWDMTQALFIVPLPDVLRNFYGVEMYKLLMAAFLIVPSAALLGTIYPQLLASPVLKKPGHSHLVGYVNSFNSVGCLLGALAGIFLLLPVLGSELSLKLIVILLLAVSFLFLWREHPTRRVFIRSLIGAALVLGYTVAWKWDRRILTSGLNVYFGRSASAAGSGPGIEQSSKMIFFHEAAQGGITTVVETSFKDGPKTQVARTLYSNGKFQGDDFDEGEAQIGFTVIPSLFVGGFDRALLIGLGTGHGALALRQIGYRQIDIAEFSPGIVHAAAEFFPHLNGNALSEPSVKLHLEDGRNLLLTGRGDSYDLITIEITSIWFAGSTNLYSEEFYKLAKSRLKPGGALQQWVQLHHISPMEVASALASARAAFPYVSLWQYGGQGMIVASVQPQLQREERAKFLAEVVERLVKSSGDPQKTLDRMAHAQLLNCQAVDGMLAKLRPIINTDHNRWIEFATPRYNSSSYDWATHNVAFLKSFEPKHEARLPSGRP